MALKRGSSDRNGSSVGDRLLSQLLTELDGILGINNVLLIGATNRPDIIVN